MVKSGVIFAFVALIFAVGATLISPFCTPCVAILLGLVAGYVAGLFDKPLSNGGSAKSGALAGVIGGVGGMLGQLIGTGINGVVVGPEKAAEMMRSFGLSAGGTEGAAGYWAGLIGGACCFSLVNIALMAGLGALGGLLWWQISGKKAAAVPPAMP